MKYIFLGFKFAFSFFSILPVKFRQDDDLSKNEVLKYTLYFFPFVGFVLSSFVIAIYNIFEPSYYIAFICAFIYMFLYGFIHTEAISDVVDAIYAAHSGKDPYPIIKEPHIGAMGMLYSVSFLIIKVVSLTYLLKLGLFLEFIVLSMISRLSIIYIIKLNQFKSSFVSALKSSLENNNLIFITLFYMIISFLILGINSLYIFTLISVISFFIIKYLKEKLGFLNGDTLGFNIEIIEIISIFFIIQVYLTI
jgi:adenosylcobinamide-GDP ribazoletransferase